MSTLGEVLGNPNRLTLGHFLYMPNNEAWDLGTKCLILSENEDFDEVPAVHESTGFSYILGMDQIEDIVMNATAQLKTVRLDQLLQAFQFYYNHDAFIVFGK